MAEQKVIFEAESLLRLLTAYYDGLVPMDAKAVQIGVSQYFRRYIGILVDSDQWSADADIATKDGQWPLHLRYEGRRNMAWSKSDQDQTVKWGREGEDFEIPR